ncbi:MAG: hypothetical protein KJO31_00880 [Gammaproteobacteria bacterium]|nr:hypothetical protein [Gammaproteobacteria bacterium]
MTRNLAVIVLAAAIGLAACAQTQQTRTTENDAIRWVESAAEFQALSLQTYNSAAERLHQAIADPDWSALPDQRAASTLPVAIIFDIDETLVSNAAFQRTFEPPFTNLKHHDWNRNYVATPLPGAADFANKARAAGVTLFFVTNRPCEERADMPGSCPQEATTIGDLVESGIAADSDHVMLALERPEWTSEKLHRRNHVAETHRVIMLFGDDLGDFIACSRARPLHPCREGATAASRADSIMQHAGYWGKKWFVLPNPMHGSWTTVE